MEYYGCGDTGAIGPSQNVLWSWFFSQNNVMMHQLGSQECEAPSLNFLSGTIQSCELQETLCARLRVCEGRGTLLSLGIQTSMMGL